MPVRLHARTCPRRRCAHRSSAALASFPAPSSVSPSFVRIGTFELPASRRQDELVKELLDYVVRHHYKCGSPLPPAAAASRLSTNDISAVADPEPKTSVWA